VIEPCLETEVMMERLRRQSKHMSRDELIASIDALSKLYCTTRAACKWLASGAPMG